MKYWPSGTSLPEIHWLMVRFHLKMWGFQTHQTRAKLLSSNSQTASSATSCRALGPILEGASFANGSLGWKCCWWAYQPTGIKQGPGTMNQNLRNLRKDIRILLEMQLFCLGMFPELKMPVTSIMTTICSALASKITIYLNWVGRYSLNIYASIR